MSDDSKFWDEHRAGVADDGLDFSDVPKDIMDQLAAMEQTIADLREKLRQADAENERLRGVIDMLEKACLKAKLHHEAPCCICGYNGSSYFQSNVHKCIANEAALEAAEVE